MKIIHKINGIEVAFITISFFDLNCIVFIIK